MKEINEYYLGLDMGEGSLGWAVTTPDYHVVKKAGKALWGVRLFESAKTAKERRVFRTGRRRIERRNRRIDFLQELFSEAVCEKDPGFYQRLNDSRLWEEDKTERQINSLFNDVDFTDKSYHKKFPTIYHLRQKLMEDSCEFDVRLVYLAIHHILKHRGHFLLENFEIREDGAVGFEEAMADLGNVLGQFLDRSLPVENNDACKEILKNRKLNKLEKLEQLGKLYDAGGDKSIKEIFRLIVGGTAHLAVIFCDETLKNTERGKISFEDAQYEEYKNDVQTILDDRFDVVAACETLHNWAILAELMGNYKYISDAKVAIFNEHRKDLTVLKRLLKRDSNVYTKMFRMAGKNSYSAYVGLCKIHGKKVPIEKACTQGDFAGEIKKIIKNFPDSEDKKYILDKIERNELLPKAVSKQNGVIPYQLHLVELNKILSNAERYLPFLKKEDEYGTVSDKIRKLFTFRIPYYVGPLNGHSPFAWAVRKDENGHIYPWNFERKIDIEASAEEFIRRMTNKCTYLVKKDVLPKNSLLYTEFMVLNELNNVRIGSAQEKLPPGMKARVWERLFLKDKKITAKKCVLI
jgi:CRISPR-associated protein, csn1 family